MAIPTEVGSILRLTVSGQQGGYGQIQNVWFLEVDSPADLGHGTISVQEFCHGFWAMFRDSYNADLCSEVVTWEVVRGEILDTDINQFVAAEDYVVPADESAGGRIEAASDPFAAYQIRLQRPNANFRHGYKRLGGVCDADSTNGGILTSPYASLVAFAITLSLPLHPAWWVDDVETFSSSAVGHIVVGAFVRNGDPLDEYFFERPAAFVASQIVTTQSTRKFGRGS